MISRMISDERAAKSSALADGCISECAGGASRDAALRSVEAFAYQICEIWSISLRNIGGGGDSRCAPALGPGGDGLVVRCRSKAPRSSFTPGHLLPEAGLERLTCGLLRNPSASTTSIRRESGSMYPCRARSLGVCARAGASLVVSKLNSYGYSFRDESFSRGDGKHLLKQLTNPSFQPAKVFHVAGECRGASTICGEIGKVPVANLRSMVAKGGTSQLCLWMQGLETAG